MSAAEITTFTTEAISNTAVVLIWAGVYDTLAIQKSTDNANYTTIATGISATDTYYNITGLTENTLYYFVLIPYDVSLNEGTTQTVFVTTPYTPYISSFYSGVSTLNSIPLHWIGSYYRTDVYYKKTVDVLADYQKAASVVGTSYYIVSQLLTDTSYDFQVIPYSITEESGTVSSTITASTDYIPIIGNLYLDTTASNSVKLVWDGKTSYISLQKSMDGTNYSTDIKLFLAGGDEGDISVDGSFSLVSLYPYTDYYFRAIPYSSNYNSGSISSTIYVKTLMGIELFEYSNINNTSVVFYWEGIYTTLKIRKIYYENTFTIADISNTNSDTTITTTGTYTADELSPYTAYSFYIQPYDGTEKTTPTDIIYIITDFSAQVGVTINTETLTSTTIPITFKTTGYTEPFYKTVLVQLSLDGNTYLDVSCLTATTSVIHNYTYTVEGTAGTAMTLSPNTNYYLKITPYSLYNVSGAIVYKTVATKGDISNSLISFSLDSSNQIVLDCSGNFKNAIIQYYSEPSGTLLDQITGVSAFPYTVESSVLSAGSKYYFRFVPVNMYDVSGVASNFVYNPVITALYLSDVSTNYITLNWTGNYYQATLQSRLYGETEYTDISYVATDSSTITLVLDTPAAAIAAEIPTYYRMKPYGDDGVVAGKITDDIFVPTISNFAIYSITQYDISFEWMGMYSHAKIQYSTSYNGTYTDLYDITDAQPDISAVNTVGVMVATDGEMDFKNTTYYFRIVPYSLGVGDYITTGTTTNKTYNPTITAFSLANSTTKSNNSIVASYVGTFDYAKLYFRDASSSYSSQYLELAADSSNITINGLTSITTYYFQIVPCNSADEMGIITDEISLSTVSLASTFNVIYDPSNSTTNSVYFYWNDMNYNYVDVFNSAGTFLQRFYTSENTYYDSSALEVLEANTEYTYYINLYDFIGSKETTTITTYTTSSLSLFNITYSAYATGVTFSWVNSGYTSLYIQNVSTSSDVLTISSGTTYYDSYYDETYSAVTNKSFIQNTQYTYLFTLKNIYGTPTTKTLTITTLGDCEFDVINTGSQLITTTSIPLELRGTFSGAEVTVTDSAGSTQTTIFDLSAVFTAGTFPLSMYYYYTFNADFYNYNMGYSVEDAMEYNVTSCVTGVSKMGTGSLYLNSAQNQYIELTPFANSTEDEGMTFTCWFKSNSSSNAKLFDFGGLDNVSRLYCNVNSSTNSGNTVIYHSYLISGVTVVNQLVLSAYNDNSWHHIAVIFSNIYSMWEAYVDGVLVSTLTNIKYPILTKNFTNYIGKGITLIDTYFNGYIDDFRIYSTPITSAVIQNLYLMGGYDISLNSVNSIISAQNEKYTFLVRPLNADGIAPSLTTTTAYAYTLGKMGAFYITSADTSGVFMYCDGSYSYFTVQCSTDASFQTILSAKTSSASSIYINGLVSNNTYYFRTIPFNTPLVGGGDVSGVVSATKYTTTLGSITAIAASSFTNESVYLAWDGSYSKVALKQSTDGTIYKNISGYFTGTNTTITDLSSNTKYYYIATPINHGDVSGVPHTAVNTTTLANISTIYVDNIKSTSVRLYLTGSSYVSYYVDISGGEYDTSSNVVTTSPITLTGLTPNTTYDLIVNVFNTTTGTGISTQKTYYGAKTLAYIGIVDLSAISSSIVRITLPDSLYSSYYVGYSMASGSVTYLLCTSSPVDISGLTSNTSYTFTIYGYNNVSGMGTSVSKSSSITTLPYIENINISSISASSLSVALSSGSSFSSYKVLYTDISATNTTITSASSTTSPLVLTGLPANTIYSMTVHAYNTSSGTGIPVVGVMGNTVTTLGAITSFYTGSIVDNSSVILVWDGSYSSVGLEGALDAGFSTGATGYTYTRITTVSADKQYYVTGLSQNTKYYFRVTPYILESYYGEVDTSGVSVTNDVSGTTYPTLPTFSLQGEISTNTMGVIWDGSYSAVYVQYSTDGGATYTTFGSYTTKYATITGLQPNTQYYIRGMPINSVGLSGGIFSSAVTAKTLSAVTSFYTAGVRDSSSIWVFVDGSYSAVVLESALDASFSSGEVRRRVAIRDVSYQITDLSQNTKYYFRATPVGDVYLDGMDVSGATVTADVSGTTFGTITTFAIGTDISSNSLPILIDGSYTAVSIYQSTDSATYYEVSGSPFTTHTLVVMSGISADTTYYYEAAPINSAGATSTYIHGPITSKTLAYIGNTHVSSIVATGFTVNLTSSYYTTFKVGYFTTAAGSGTTLYTSLVSYPATSVDLSGLVANTSYQCIIYAYNTTDGSGTVVTNTIYDTVTLPAITNAIINNSSTDLSSTFFTATVLGEYTSFRVTYTADGVDYTQGYFNDASTNTFTISNLTANTTYYYTVYVNNRADGAGTDISGTFSATTLGSTPLFNLKTYPAETNSISFTMYSGNFSYIVIQTATDSAMTSILHTATIAVDDISSVYNNTYTQTDISENTDYYFNCTPYNSLGVAGSSSTTLHSVTLGNITAASVNDYSGITASSIPITWTGTYNTLLVEYSAATADGTYTPFTTYTNTISPNNSTVNTGNIVVTGLDTDTQYLFRVTPINSLSYVGSSYVWNDSSAVTLGQISNMTRTALADISACFVVDGSFNGVSVYSSPESLVKTYYANSEISTGDDISGLTPNTSYTYYFEALNSIYVPNPDDASYTIITAAKIAASSVSVVPLSTSSLYATWDFTGIATGITTLVETSMDSGVTYNTVTSTTNTSATITDLSLNTEYYVRLTPNGYGDVSGTAVIQGNTTLSNITAVSTYSADASSVRLLMDGSFIKVDISNGSLGYIGTYNYALGGVITGVSDISGLSPYTAYTFTLTPYNNVNTPSSSVSYTAYTQSSILGVSYYDSSYDRIYMNVSGGTYTSYNVYYSSDSGTSYSLFSTETNSTTLVVTGLDANTGYIFKIQPYSGNTGAYGVSYVTETYYTKPSITTVGLSGETAYTITLTVV
jgi:hypothetical protein